MRNLGVVFDSDLSHEAHVSQLTAQYLNDSVRPGKCTEIQAYLDRTTRLSLLAYTPLDRLAIYRKTSVQSVADLTVYIRMISGRLTSHVQGGPKK